MAVITVQGPEVSERRARFLRFLFDRPGTEGGYLCIARRKPEGDGAKFSERFFEWPKDEKAALDYIDASVIGHNVWFCPMLFSEANRNKYDVLTCPAIWSDLDHCPPDELLIPPTLSLETSPGRHQGLWCLEQLAEPYEAEEVAKAIAYRHAESGADKSGWDLTQLLRVPMTLNYKYDPPAGVKLIASANVVTLAEMREAYPPVEEKYEGAFPFPEELPDGEALLRAYAQLLPSKAWMLLRVPPERDWSKPLWQLEMLLAEAGLSREEIFAIAKTAACNKYQRDGRNDELLWKEVCRAWVKHRERSTIIEDAGVFKVPDLLTDGDLKAVSEDRSFIDDYIDWAKSVGDAAEPYHQAGAFICLSALTSGSIQLPTGFGNIVPNLWFLLLADTTLTRKSTAMDIAVDMLVEVDDDVIMATDGSIEGMFTALSLRPGRPSIFLRDEFSGLLDMMVKRDYYAGMGEMLTKLYDGRDQKRVLRREAIHVRDPVFIILAGGIRTKIMNLVTADQISSGFLPRFIFIAGQSDVGKLRPLGPPEEKTTTGRDRLIQHLARLSERYRREKTIDVAGHELTTRNVQRIGLTPDAWALYNEYETKLLETGVQSASQELLTPVMDRLAKSGLKAAMLIAASRMPENLIVEERDLKKAFAYVLEWRGYAMDVVSNVGLPQQERLIQVVLNSILKHPGISRSALMSKYHLTKRDAEVIFDTLDQRGQIDRIKRGKTEIFHITGDE